MDGYIISSVIYFLLEVYFSMFPLFKSDRFNVFKKGEYGKKLHKEGERERGSRQSIFMQLLFVRLCLH